MTHEFDRARVVHDEGGSWLCLHVKNAPMARVECEQMKKGKLYCAEVKRKYDKRSGRANAYLWQMLGKLAAVLGMKRDEVYRSYIPEVGDNYRLVPYANEQQRDLIANLWEKQGLGWVTQDCNGGLLMCYYGSSTYNTVQMGRLIDMIVQDCKEQGIETEPESTVLGWLAKWKPEERGV